MLEKAKAVTREDFVEMLMRKQEQGNDAILTTMKGDFYGRVVSAGFDKVTINMNGEIKTIKIDDILDIK